MHRGGGAGHPPLVRPGHLARAAHLGEPRHAEAKEREQGIAPWHGGDARLEPEDAEPAAATGGGREK